MVLRYSHLPDSQPPNFGLVTYIIPLNSVLSQGHVVAGRPRVIFAHPSRPVQPPATALGTGRIRKLLRDFEAVPVAGPGEVVTVSYGLPDYAALRWRR